MKIREESVILAFILFTLISTNFSYALTEEEARNRAENLQEGQSVNGDNIIIDSVTIKRENFLTRFFRNLFTKQEALGLRSSYNQGDRIPLSLLFYLRDTCPSGRVEYWAILKHRNSNYIDASLFILSQTGWTDGRLYTIQKSGGINTGDITPAGEYTLTDYIWCDVQDRKMRDKDGKTEFTATFTLIGEQICEEDWQCGEWSECSNNQQTKICTDENDCGTINDKPETIRSCNSPPPNLCEGITCESTERICDDGTTVSCQNSCTSGQCSECDPSSQCPDIPPQQCTVDADCDDNNDRTEDKCISNLCKHTIIEPKVPIELYIGGGLILVGIGTFILTRKKTKGKRR